MNAPIPLAWQSCLASEFESARMKALGDFLRSEKAMGKTIYPRPKLFFRALEFSAPEEVNVVILGQDPYHGPDQAEGLAFSVPQNIPLPPSLINIYKELQSDLGIPPAKHGHLGKWAKQGVLLLNSVLSVEANQAASHAGKGWEEFTDVIIKAVNAGPAKVFILWGAYAQKKAINLSSKHLVIKSPHPSPLSAHRGFFGSKPFSKTNQFLSDNGRKVIDWRLD